MAKNKIPRYILLQELARRKGLLAQAGSFRLEDYLFDKQLAFVQDPAPFKVAVTTRRAGKTISCAADLVYTALESPDVIVLYITLSRKNAKRLVWPEFKKLNERFGLKGEVNESDLSIRFPNKSMLYLLGASDRTSIEDFRGLPVKKVYLDESQSFPSYIEQLIDDVLGPALLDHNGQLILIGTPGPIPNGYFYELSYNPNWSHHAWSFFDNPKLPFLAKGLTHQDMLQRELTRRGVKSTDPSIQREWFGKWIVDDNSLVYHYNEELNDYGSLPSGKQWVYILGVDLGFEDSDALAVLAYSEQSPNTYLVEEIVTKRQDITALCNQIEVLRQKYQINRIVVDTGGLGKKITEEISKRFAVPMLAAEKQRKVEYIELMNDALRTGRLKIKANSVFAHDANKVEWDHDHSTPDKKVISKRFHSDICEAVLYAWRDSYSYTYRRPVERPEFGTTAWSNQQAEEMFQGELERAERAQEELGLEPQPEVDLDNENLQVLDRPKGRYEAMFKRKKGP
jgi:Terminase RNaseH-like domain